MSNEELQPCHPWWHGVSQNVQQSTKSFREACVYINYLWFTIIILVVKTAQKRFLNEKVKKKFFGSQIFWVCPFGKPETRIFFGLGVWFLSQNIQGYTWPSVPRTGNIELLTFPIRFFSISSKELQSAGLPMEQQIWINANWLPGGIKSISFLRLKGEFLHRKDFLSQTRTTMIKNITYLGSEYSNIIQ